MSSPGADGSIGKVWIFNRNAGVWTKESTALVGTEATGVARQGWSVAISSDGTVIESGPYDNDGAGAVWIFHNPTLGIAQNSGTPSAFKLEQNYPNPFNQRTTFIFQIQKSSAVKVTVCDLTGRAVTTLVNEQLTPGAYTADFDGSNYTGGTYFYKLETDGFIEIKKMILLK